MRILIVEDDPALLQAIEACFELPESVDNLVSASRLEDALGVLRSQRVDVVQWGAPEVAALFGAPGTGKTALLQETTQRLNRVHQGQKALYLECEPGIGRVGLLQAMLDQIGSGVCAVDGRMGLCRVTRLIEAAGTRLVVFDDAHRLYKPTLEMVLALFCHNQAAFVLAGPEKALRRRLQRVPELKARIGRVRRLEALDFADVERVLAELGFHTHQGGKLARMLYRHSQGNWARLVRLLDRCEEQLQPVPQLYRKHVLRASQDLGLGGEAA